MLSITKTVYIDDQKVEFSRLALNDLFSLCDAAQAEREQVARQLCKQESMDRYETMNVILDLRRNKITIQELLASINSPQGAYEVLVKSLVKSGKKDDEAKKLIERLNVPDCIDTARMLVLDVQEEPAEEKKPEVNAESPLAEPPSTSPELPKPPVDGKPDPKNLGFYGKTEQTA